MRHARRVPRLTYNYWVKGQAIASHRVDQLQGMTELPDRQMLHNSSMAAEQREIVLGLIS